MTMRREDTGWQELAPLLWQSRQHLEWRVSGPSTNYRTFQVALILQAGPSDRKPVVLRGIIRRRTDHQDRILYALNHEIRRDILKLSMQGTQQAHVVEISRGMNVGVSKVSCHFKVLRDNGLVEPIGEPQAGSCEALQWAYLSRRGRSACSGDLGGKMMHMNFKVEVTTTESRRYIEVVNAPAARLAIRDAAAIVRDRENPSVLCAREIGTGENARYFW